MGAAPRVSSGRFTLSARTLAVILAAGFLLVAACSSNSSDTSSSSSDEPSTETTAESAPPDSTATGPTVPRPDQSGGKAKSVNFALPAGGPPDAIFPDPPKPAYELLFSNRCPELLKVVSDSWDPEYRYLYRGAAHACLKQWDEAQRDYDTLRQLNPDYSALTCPSDPKEPCGACKAAVYRWLGDVLAAHANDPSFAPVFVKAPRSSRVCTPTSSSTDPPTTAPPTTDTNP